MKCIVSVLMIGILLTACNNNEKKTDGFLINGSAEGVYNGMRVILSIPGERGRQIPQDTAIVIDGNFKFEGKVEYPQMWFLTLTNSGGTLPIMIENEVIEIKLIKDSLEASPVTGTKANEALSDYTKGFKKLIAKRVEVNKKLALTMNSDDASKNTLTDEMAEITKKLQKYPYDFLNTHNDNFFALSLLEIILQGNPLEVKDIDDAYINLDDNIKNSFYGEVVGSKINALKQKNESLTMLNIGKEAPNFTAPDPDGKQLSLHDIKGKATIIDFWASWCGPCRKENPNVVNVYNKYHDKGLEIISVSLDRPGQKDKWLKAIEDDKLTWYHVSNLNYFNDPVAQQYNIQSIPATFILDAEGKIVAKSLRGQALEDKIAEMLK